MKKILHILPLVFLLILVSLEISGQEIRKKVIVNWKGVQPIEGFNYETLQAYYADGLNNNPARNFTPEYTDKFKLPENVEDCDILVTHTVWEAVNEADLAKLTFPLKPDEKLQPVIKTGTERGVKMAMLSMVPIVVNPDGGLMRLKSFTIDLVYGPAKPKPISMKSEAYITHSVLAQGNWYKIQLDKTGIYKITYSEIQAMGVNMATVTPSNIRLFGNGGAMLPESNSIARYDDLPENAISVVTASPGVFAPGDYILFYGTAPSRMFYNKTQRRFEHSFNLYSNYSYYFLNFDSGPGLRIGDQSSSSLSPTYTSTEFTEGVFYEKDLLNFIKSGKDWVGERMDPGTPVYELPQFSFPNISPTKQSTIRCRVTSRSGSGASFKVKANDVEIGTPYCPPSSEYNYATERTETKSFASAEKLKISFQYTGSSSAIGWLDWVELNVPRDLKFTGGQMAFADPASAITGAVTEFLLSGSSANVTIWEITNPLQAKRIPAELQGNVSRFVLKTDTLRQFVAWDNTSFLSAKFTEKVANQDLHGIASTDMLIVTDKLFVEEANRLADHHRLFDGLRVNVITNEQIFNEFSSGSPDPVAIRDFARLLYQRPAAGNKLRYLLLFGDGSYDFKDRVPFNTNKVLTFQTKESLNTVYSYASDDFYGILDANEGNDAVGLIDIGIGRFPVNTAEEAKMAVDKCIFYATNSSLNMGDWRNKLCFVADNGNSNTHFRQVEKQICPLIENIAPVYNLDKIYIDAYKPVSTPSGQKCPDANAGITSNVQNGVLLINYTGHGGETGWADEGILTIREIKSWTNYKNMPVFMTATCEFSRYDDPDPARVSAGEHVFLNPLGGGVALFTTTRLANAGTNIGLTLYFYDTLFSKSNGEYPRFGDVISYAKNRMGGFDASLVRNFVLLGDPALRLAYPKYNVVTTHINGKPINQEMDTIPAMQAVELKGLVTDGSGHAVTNFDGELDIKVFDKVRTLTTLGSLPGDYPDKYTLQDNYVYQGRATVTKGEFTVQFMVPRDIDYSYGPGKISYYAHNDVLDANGFSKKLMIGGSGSQSTDNVGPEISLFLNDENFVNGATVGDMPLLVAHLSDASGINTIGNSIGHDIVATLDGDNTTSVVLNSYYSANLDSYQSGVVNFKMPQLPEGKHTLTLKVWDVFNNSSETTITFYVSKDIPLTITSMNSMPNPFREGLDVEFETNLFDTPLEAYLEIFNINGSLVNSTVPQTIHPQGYYVGKIHWDGRSASGSQLQPGVYLVALRVSGGGSATVKATRVIKVK